MECLKFVYAPAMPGLTASALPNSETPAVNEMKHYFCNTNAALHVLLPDELVSKKANVMRIAAILPVLALVCVNLRAQATAVKPGSVEGIVSNSVTREPVRKVVVTLEGSLQRPGAPEPLHSVVITDSSGRFHFDNVPPGSYNITANRDGFTIGGATHTRAAPKTITVAEDQHFQDVAIQLVPLGAVSGRVVDEDGDPIVRARVTVLRYFYGARRRRLIPEAITQSNDLGEFGASNLAPGRYYVQVVAVVSRNIPPHTRWTHPEVAYPVTFYPNAREPAQASAIDMPPGGHVNNIDFRLMKLPAYHVRGTVIDGNPELHGIQNAVIVELPGGGFGGSVGGTSIQSDGSFDLPGLVSGSYLVTYRHVTEGKMIVTDEAIQVADADVNGVALTVRPGASVSGIVMVDGARPDQMNLQAILSLAHGRSQGENINAGADGRFVLPLVPLGVYELKVFKWPPGTYVKSIRFGDREINNGEIDLSIASSASVNIVLGADGGEVDGTVQTASGQPAAATQVMLAPAEEYDGREDLLKRVFTDPAGSFQIKDVAPGEYKVFAWEDDPDGSTQSAEFRKPFESKSVAVTVGSKDKASVQLTVITADDLDQGRSKLP
jgi:hypothetical protein